MRNHEATQLSLSSQHVNSVSNNNLIKGAGAKDQHQLESNKPNKTKEQADRKRNEWRITKMVLAIFLSFLACYLPITIIKVVDKDVNYPGLHIFGYLMIYLSACVNPIIYVIMNKQYRQAYKSVLLCKNRLSTLTNDG